MNNIPAEIYAQIHHAVPIACVDVVLKKDNTFLLVKRTNKPAQGQWWIPGGRILKGEILEDSARRKVRQETGAGIRIERILGADETLFSDGPFNDSTHTINVVFLATIEDQDTIVKLDPQNDEYQWFSYIDPVWHPYVKKFLALAGFIEQGN
ncbi:MAG: NUDIX domain-containing protein [bacterium]|nr:NUDIX domain-containing protein [bacterium]